MLPAPILVVALLTPTFNVSECRDAQCSQPISPLIQFFDMQTQLVASTSGAATAGAKASQANAGGRASSSPVLDPSKCTGFSDLLARLGGEEAWFQQCVRKYAGVKGDGEQMCRSLLAVCKGTKDLPKGPVNY